jgi:hypothetical protein
MEFYVNYTRILRFEDHNSLVYSMPDLRWNSKDSSIILFGYLHTYPGGRLKIDTWLL